MRQRFCGYVYSPGMAYYESRVSDFPVLESVLPIDVGAIAVGIQPAFGLREVQIEGAGLTIGCQQFPDIVHLLAGLLGRLELLEGNQRGCQRFRDDPFVVTSDSLSRHGDPHPLSGQRSKFR